MSEYSETVLAILFIYLMLPVYFAYAVLKRRESGLKYLIAGGIFFNITFGGWGFVSRHFLLRSEIFREDYGTLVGAFFMEGYFIVFHTVLLIGYAYLIWKKLDDREGVVPD